MVSRENKNDAYAKFGGTNVEYTVFPKWPITRVSCLHRAVAFFKMKNADV